MDKKGMTPIIATILLIAFAVAIGAMIMNWSTTLVTEGERESSCEEAKLQLRRPLCYSNNKITLELVSVPSDTVIEGVVMSISSAESDQDIHIKNSKLQGSDVVVRRVPLLEMSDFVINLHAKIIVDNHEEVCPQSLHRTSELPPC